MISSVKSSLPESRSGQPRFRRLEDWLAWQEQLHVREIDLGLGRVRKVAERLDLGRPAYTVISVAGTNGKGSCVEMLHKTLSAAGYRTGVYTSPHLIRYNERIRVAGEAVSDAQLCDAFQRIDEARAETSITYFEFGTLAALDIFAHADIEIAILEVGLGGRLDAVNLLDPDVALITTIDLDHLEWLGDNRESIGHEKAGILRPGRPAVCADPEPPQSILDDAGKLGVPLAVCGRDYHFSARMEGWCWRGARTRFEHLPLPILPGDFQLQNAAGVLAVIEALPSFLAVSEAHIRQGLVQATLNGRFQCLDGPVQYVLDVAHNPQAARALAATLDGTPVPGRTHALLGMLRDKDCRGVVECLRGRIDAWHLATITAGHRGARAGELRQAMLAAGISEPISTYADVAQALSRLWEITREGDRVLVIGSFLTVSAALSLLAGPDRE